MNTTDVAAVIAATGPVLLDFDGPVCSIFAGLSASDVAAELAAQLPASLRTQLDPAGAWVDDPLQLLRELGWVADAATQEAADLALTQAELRAVMTALPTVGGHEVLAAAVDANRPVAIVSNNSTSAIVEYLRIHDLHRAVAGVFGRVRARPNLLKPHPHLLVAAIESIGSDAADRCVMVGDSVTDITAAQAAGTQSIGYANKPGKARELRAAQADAVTESMNAVAQALRDAVSGADRLR